MYIVHHRVSFSRIKSVTSNVNFSPVLVSRASVTLNSVLESLEYMPVTRKSNDINLNYSHLPVGMHIFVVGLAAELAVESFVGTGAPCRFGCESSCGTDVSDCFFFSSQLVGWPAVVVHLEAACNDYLHL
jgi:hypothetical protein